MKSFRSIPLYLMLLLIHLIFGGCQSTQDPQDQQKVESAMLLEWLVQNGNWINSQQVPAVITATEAYQALNDNTLFIDLRDASQFAAGHIPGAINITPSELLNYFDNRLDINAFEKVILVCSRGQLSSWVNGIVRQLGYNNTYSIRYGLSAWDTSFAANGWDKVISSKYADNIVKGPSPNLSEKFELPHIATGKVSGYEIAHHRAAELLAEQAEQHFIEWDSLRAHAEKYFIINYWPTADYEEVGHLQGAFQFSPRKSLSVDAMLLNIPPDRKVVVYCYSGHHAVQAVAFLRMLGYDAYSLLYGANAFMHNQLTRQGWPASHAWGDGQKNTYPLTKAGAGPVQAGEQIKKAAQGGC